MKRLWLGANPDRDPPPSAEQQKFPWPGAADLTNLRGVHTAENTLHTVSPNQKPEMRAYKPLGSVLNGRAVSESFHRGLAHVEAITDEMSRVCQELLELWTLRTTDTNREIANHPKQHAGLSSYTCCAAFSPSTRHSCMNIWILNKKNSCWNSQNI